MSRKRIDIGFLGLLLFMVCISLSVVMIVRRANGAPAASQPAPVLIVANGNGWKTSIVASSATGGKLAYSDSQLVPAATIPAEGTYFLRDVSAWLTPGLKFGAIAEPDLNVDAYSVLTFQASQFTVPALARSLVGVGESAEISRVVNDGTDGTFLVFYNASGVAGGVTLNVYDGTSPVATEFVSLAPGVTPYTLVTHVAAGRIEVVDGYEHFNSPAITIYAFAAIGPASGASQRIEVLR